MVHQFVVNDNNRVRYQKSVLNALEETMLAASPEIKEIQAHLKGNEKLLYRLNDPHNPHKETLSLILVTDNGFCWFSDAQTIHLKAGDLAVIPGNINTSCSQFGLDNHDPGYFTSHPGFQPSGFVGTISVLEISGLSADKKEGNSSGSTPLGSLGGGKDTEALQQLLSGGGGGASPPFDFRPGGGGGMPKAGEPLWLTGIKFLTHSTRQGDQASLQLLGLEGAILTITSDSGEERTQELGYEAICQWLALDPRQNNVLLRMDQQQLIISLPGHSPQHDPMEAVQDRLSVSLVLSKGEFPPINQAQFKSNKGTGEFWTGASGASGASGTGSSSPSGFSGDRGLSPKRPSDDKGGGAPEQRGYVCDLCRKTFSSANKLRIHIIKKECSPPLIPAVVQPTSGTLGPFERIYFAEQQINREVNQLIDPISRQLPDRNYWVTVFPFLVAECDEANRRAFSSEYFKAINEQSSQPLMETVIRLISQNSPKSYAESAVQLFSALKTAAETNDDTRYARLIQSSLESSSQRVVGFPHAREILKHGLSTEEWNLIFNSMVHKISSGLLGANIMIPGDLEEFLTALHLSVVRQGHFEDAQAEHIDGMMNLITSSIRQSVGMRRINLGEFMHSLSQHLHSPFTANIIFTLMLSPEIKESFPEFSQQVRHLVQQEIFNQQDIFGVNQVLHNSVIANITLRLMMELNPFGSTGAEPIKTGKPKGIRKTGAGLPLTLETLSLELNGLVEWFRFGIFLGFDYSDLEKIEREATSIDRRKERLFADWLKTCPEPSWDKVIEALKKLTLNTMADNLELKLAKARQEPAHLNKKPSMRSMLSWCSQLVHWEPVALILLDPDYHLVAQIKAESCGSNCITQEKIKAWEYVLRRKPAFKTRDLVKALEEAGQHAIADYIRETPDP